MLKKLVFESERGVEVLVRYNSDDGLYYVSIDDSYEFELFDFKKVIDKSIDVLDLDCE